MQSTERLELEIDLIKKKRGALDSDLTYKGRQYSDNMPCDGDMADPDMAILMMSSIVRDRDRLDVEIAEKKLELYDLQAGKTADQVDGSPEPETPSLKVQTNGGTHAEQIVRAAAALAGTSGNRVFTRKAVRDHLGLSNRRWQSGYTAIFQGMRDDQPGGAPQVGAEYQGAFHRVSSGTYQLTAKARVFANQLGA